MDGWMDSRITFPFNIVAFPPYCFTFLSIPCKFYHLKELSLFRPTSVSCQLQLHQDKPGKSMANFGNFMKKKLAGKFDPPGEKVTRSVLASMSPGPAETSTKPAENLAEPAPRIISSNIGFLSQPQPDIGSDSSSASESEENPNDGIGWGEQIALLCVW